MPTPVVDVTFSKPPIQWVFGRSETVTVKLKSVPVSLPGGRTATVGASGSMKFTCKMSAGITWEPFPWPWVSFSCKEKSGGDALQLDFTDAVDDLFEGLSPAQAIQWAQGTLHQEVWDAVGGDIIDGITGGLLDFLDGSDGDGISSWGFWDVIGLGHLIDALASQTRDAIEGIADGAKDLLKSAIDPLFSGVLGELVDYAEGFLDDLADAADDLWKKAFDLVLAISQDPLGALADMLDKAMDQLGDLLADLQDALEWLLDKARALLSGQDLLDVVADALAELILAHQNAWDANWGWVEDQLEAVFKGANKLPLNNTQARWLVETVMGAVQGQLAPASSPFSMGTFSLRLGGAGSNTATAPAEVIGDIFIDLVFCFADLLTGFGQALWETVGWLVGGIVATIGDALDPLMNAFWSAFRGVEAAADEVRDNVLAFLGYLGSQNILETVLTWMKEHWDNVVAPALGDAAAEVEQMVDLVLDYLTGALGSLLEGLQTVLPMLEQLRDAPDRLLSFAGDVAQDPLGIKAMGTFLQEPMGFLMAQAEQAGTDLAGALQTLLRDNPIARFLREIPGYVQDIAEALGAGELAGALNELAALPQQVEALALGTGEGIEELAQDVRGALDAAVEQLANVEAAFHGLVQGEKSEPWILDVRLQAMLAGNMELDEAGEVVDFVGEAVEGVLSGEQDFFALLSQLSFLHFEERGDRLRVPHPADGTPLNLNHDEVPWLSEPVNSLEIPLCFPFPWSGSVAVAHKPEFWVIDMRYHMPYSRKVGRLQLVDLDGDGVVREWEVDRVRAAVGKQIPALDIDGDGTVTADDVQLAVAQQENLVAGVMYRPTTAPLGFWVSTQVPGMSLWGFYAITDIAEEDIPGKNGLKLDRNGLLILADGQLRIPLPTGDIKVPAPPDGDGAKFAEVLDGFFDLLPQGAYVIRYHNELRFYFDRFNELGIGGVPLMTGGVRMDSILRGGEGGRDWQLYLQSDPANIMLRRFTLRGSLYFRGLTNINPFSAIGWGVATKGDLRVQVAYDMEAPLIEVWQQWHERLTNAGEPEFELPVPWELFRGILEGTEIPRLCRALIQIAGPLLDLFMDWVDSPVQVALLEGDRADGAKTKEVDVRRLRAVLGYLRQTVLSGWQPGRTWKALRTMITQRAGDDAAARDAALGALDAARDAFCQEAGIPDVGDEALAPAVVPKEIGRRVEEALADLATDKATAITSLFAVTERHRYAASLEQLVGEQIVEELERRRETPDGPRLSVEDAERSDEGPVQVDVPLCGRLKVIAPRLLAFPFSYDELKSVQVTTTNDDGQATGAELDQGTASKLLGLRGNPFHKPLYHSIILFGEDAQLYAIPKADPRFLVQPVGAGQKGIVEDSRILEDEHGHRWFWVHIDSDWRHGWIRLDKFLCDVLFSPEEFFQGTGQDFFNDFVKDASGAAQNALTRMVIDPASLALLEDGASRGLSLIEQIDPATHQRIVDAIGLAEGTAEDLDRELQKKLFGNRTVTRLEPSTPETIDETRYAGQALRALAKNDAGIRKLYQDTLRELTVRVFGLEAADDMGPDDLFKAWNGLSHAKQEKLWSSTAAFMKCAHYMPLMAKYLLEGCFVHLIHFPLIPISTILPPFSWLIGFHYCAFQACMGKLGLDMLDGGIPRIDRFFLGEDLTGETSGLLHFLGQVKDFTLDEAILTAQTIVPPILEVVDVVDAIAKKITLAKEAAESGELDVEGESAVDSPPGAAPSWENLGEAMLRLFIDDQEAPGRPPPAPGAENDHWGIELSYHLRRSKVEPDPAAAGGGAGAGGLQPGQQQVLLARPVVSQVEHFRVNPEEEPDSTAPRPGETIALRVTQWGAVVHDAEGKHVWTPGADQARIPKELVDGLKWRVWVKPEGAPIADVPVIGDGEWKELPNLLGPEVTYTVPEDLPGTSADKGTKLIFEAYLERPLEGHYPELAGDRERLYRRCGVVYTHPAELGWFIVGQEGRTPQFIDARAARSTRVMVVHEPPPAPPATFSWELFDTIGNGSLEPTDQDKTTVSWGQVKEPHHTDAVIPICTVHEEGKEPVVLDKVRLRLRNAAHASCPNCQRTDMAYLLLPDDEEYSSAGATSSDSSSAFGGDEGMAGA